jgi:hypothetical protein
MKVLSLGMGVQSTALYYMSSMGELPKFDYAIFVDPGREKIKTYGYLKFLQAWQKDNNGLPIIVVRKLNLWKDLLISQNSRGRRFSSIPAYTKNLDGTTGMLRRQCTKEYKVDQVDKEIRQILAVKRILNQKIEVWKGISLEEIERLSIPEVFWKVHVYPFCGYTVSRISRRKVDTQKFESKIMSRNDIINWYNAKGLPVPPKSSCVFCPFQSEAAWYDMKVNSPSDFKAAVRIDNAIRNSSQKGVENQIFLHESCTPLSEIEFVAGQPDLWHGDCSGHCHT